MPNFTIMRNGLNTEIAGDPHIGQSSEDVTVAVKDDGTYSGYAKRLYYSYCYHNKLHRALSAVNSNNEFIIPVQAFFEPGMVKLSVELSNGTNCPACNACFLIVTDGAKDVDASVLPSEKTWQEYIQSYLKSDIVHKPTVDALEKRIDNLILSSGSESSAEVVDARNGYDGTTYDTLGTAIRTQIKNTRPDHINYYIDTSLKGFNTDANIYMKNGIYWINLLSGLTNLHFPNIRGVGTFKVFAHSDAYVQQTIETMNGSFVRFCIDGNWREWQNFGIERSMPYIYIDDSGHNIDANTYTKSNIYWINLNTDKDVTNLHFPNIRGVGTFKVFAYSDAYVQQTIETMNGSFVRFCIGGKWGEWRDIANTSEMNDARVGIDGTKYSDLGTAIRTQIKNSGGGIKPYATGLAQFKKFGVIGDSLSVGHFSGTSTRNLWYSWPQSVARMHGNTAVNFGKSGDSVLSWWHESSQTGKDLLGASGNKCQAYVIALGVNDTGGRNVPLGSFSDIDLSDYNNNKETWYGGYARIIQYINSINPNAIIFCLTNVWTNSEKSHQFDDAIKEILANETLGKQCLLVDMVANYADEFNAFKNKYAMNGHNNANGYAIGGRIIDMAIGETFADSKFETVDIGLIPCDE